jgi:hypothetical protein
MNDIVERQILDQLLALRTELSRMTGEMAELRNKIADLTSASAPQAAIERLWFEGLASGDAGALDDVFDEVLARLPRSEQRP